MDWEDDMMEWEDTPSLSWKEIERMERNRKKAKRLRRIKIHADIKQKDTGEDGSV